MSAQGFWDDTEKAQGVVKQLKGFKSTVSMPDELHREIEDGVVLVEMAQEEEDEEHGGGNRRADRGFGEEAPAP
jgi:hypothetical protein